MVSAPTLGKKFGLSLVALVGIVIPVLFVGSTIALVTALSPYMNKDSDAADRIELLTIQFQLEMYRAEYGKYPATLAELVPTYATEVPRDGDTNEPYKYTVDVDGTQYEVCTPVTVSSVKAECVTSPKPESPDTSTIPASSLSL